jgi:hypothetical protein
MTMPGTRILRFWGACGATLLVLMLFARPYAAQAQSRAQLGVRTGGALVTLLTDDETRGISRRPALRAGIFLRYPVGDRWALQPELVYAQKGGARRNPGPLGAPAGAFRLHYLELPLLARVEVDGEGPLRIALLAGPAFGLNVGARFAPYADAWGQGSDGSSRTRDVNVTQTEWSGVIGSEFAYQLSGGGTVVLHLRYHVGVTDIIPDPEIALDSGAIVGTPGSGAWTLNDVLGLSLGYAITL